MIVYLCGVAGRWIYIYAQWRLHEAQKRPQTGSLFLCKDYTLLMRCHTSSGESRMEVRFYIYFRTRIILASSNTRVRYVRWAHFYILDILKCTGRFRNKEQGDTSVLVYVYFSFSMDKFNRLSTEIQDDTLSEFKRQRKIRWSIGTTLFCKVQPHTISQMSI